MKKRSTAFANLFSMLYYFNLQKIDEKNAAFFKIDEKKLLPFINWWKKNKKSPSVDADLF